MDNKCRDKSNRFGKPDRRSARRSCRGTTAVALLVIAMLLVGATPAFAATVASTTSVTATPNPARLGQAVTFTATVTPQTATGTVQFKIDGANVASGTVTSGKATVAMSTSPAVGTHTVTAHYSGDSAVDPSSGTLAGGLKVVPVKEDTTTTLTVSPNPVKWGESVQFTAKVSPATATGHVQFKVDGAGVSGGQLQGGQIVVAMSHSPGAGIRTVTAVYGGDEAFNPSTGTASLQVQKRDPIIEVSSNRNPAKPGETVVLTANVAVPTSSGTVQFKIDGANFSAPVAVHDRKASVEVRNLSTGNHSVTAGYSGGEPQPSKRNAPGWPEDSPGRQAGQHDSAGGKP